MHMIKVLFVFSDPCCSCTCKRAFEVASGLHQYVPNGLSVNITHYKKLFPELFKSHDIILFQRLGANGGILTDAEKEDLFQLMDQYRHQTVYVYDIDDYLFHRQNGLPIQMMKQCHWGLAPNEFLLEKMLEYQSNCHIIRTHIDLEGVERALKYEGLDHRMINVGWFSYRASGIHILEAISAKLLQQYEGRLQIHSYTSTPFLSVIQKRFNNRLVRSNEAVSLVTMHSHSKAMDFLINPLDYSEDLSQTGTDDLNSQQEKDNFINSKSEIKYLHAGAVGKPLITTAIPAYQSTMTHGVSGFLVNTPEDWLSCMRLLIENPQIRREIGKRAQAHVYDQYSLRHAAENYAEFFRRIA